jgi:D-alanyl-lipoteichoic acid acyltransferase DltB (MBOAT superfamily)
MFGIDLLRTLITRTFQRYSEFWRRWRISFCHHGLRLSIHSPWEEAKAQSQNRSAMYYHFVVSGFWHGPIGTIWHGDSLMHSIFYRYCC